ncbi:DUF551 domain-containing protein [Citrobacter freundii]
MTTNNHPAHGPVSLDLLHQIREILSKAAAQSDGGNLGYAMADAVKVIDEVLEARNAEPVVLDEDPRDAFERSFKMSKHVTRCGTGYAVTEYSAWLAHDFIRMWEGWKACRAAMLQSFGNSEQLDEVGSWDNHMNTPTDKPAINTDELLKHIEGMEVSVDVSTCDADAGHRYFGTVTEISELDTARNGYILLVQDAKPNFKPAGNSPVTTDGWIPVSERMPNKLIPVMVMYEDGEMWSAMWNGNRWDDGTEYPDPHSVIHWRKMPAAPKQEVKLALEHGMQRYAGAMQKLADAGD